MQKGVAHDAMQKKAKKVRDTKSYLRAVSLLFRVKGYTLLKLLPTQDQWNLPTQTVNLSYYINYSILL
jgi:hypothetical protein